MKVVVTDFAKTFILLLVLLSLFFGRWYYFILLATLLYFFLYRFSLMKTSFDFRVKLQPYTIHQGDSILINYLIDWKSILPQQVFAEFIFPGYIVHQSGERRLKIFARKMNLEREIKAGGTRRGIYSVGELLIGFSDPFGFFNLSQTINCFQKVYVFPFLVPIEKLKIHLSDPIEGIKAKYQNNKDYSYIAGIRDYSSMDPISMIHWKQTAHRGKLSVKEFDFTASKKIVIALNFFNKNAKFQDYASSLAASICYYANKNHLPFGVFVNGSEKKKLKVEASEFHLYEAFKELSFYTEKAFETHEFINEISQLTPFGSEIFYIDKDINEASMLNIMKIKPNFSKINIILILDDVFVLPREKPPYYYFKETEYLRFLKNSIEGLAKEGINVYPILGRDTIKVLEK